MLREGTLEEISDGRLYELNDMVRADCADCVGCSKCCRSDMGTSITLDPYDVWLLCLGTGRTFSSMVDQEIRLSVLDGLILPHMNMEHGCLFLNDEGRCRIHPFRPSICRLFPLGRYYEKGDFRYFLQVNECTKQNRSKVKVRKWIDIEPVEQHTEFVRKWHNFLGLARRKVKEAKDPHQIRNFMLFLLELFYVTEYEDIPGDEEVTKNEEAAKNGEVTENEISEADSHGRGEEWTLNYDLFFRQFDRRLKTAVREMKYILR